MINTNLLILESCAVMPNESPTVLNAEKTSKAILIRPLSLSLNEILNMPTPINNNDKTIMAKALLTD
jgi:hypothetical protein